MISTRVPSGESGARLSDTFGLKADDPLLHIARVDFEVLEQRAERGGVAQDLGYRVQVGFAHDFQQRDAGAVEVHQRVAIAVEQLPGVLFEMDAPDACRGLMALIQAIGQPAMLGQRRLVLRNLEPLGKIRVEVVLARKLAALGHLAAERQRDPQGVFDRLAVDDRQGAGLTGADLTHGRIGLGGGRILHGAAAEHLRAGLQLGVHLQTDDGIEVRHCE